MKPIALFASAVEYQFNATQHCE